MREPCSPSSDGMTPSEDKISQIAERAPETAVSEVKMEASSSGVAPATKRMESSVSPSLKLWRVDVSAYIED